MLDRLGYLLLAAALAMHRRGMAVVVVERTERLSAGGAALSLWPDALRGLDRLGIGDRVRRHTAARLTRVIPASVIARSLAPVIDWQPPGLGSEP